MCKKRNLKKQLDKNVNMNVQLALFPNHRLIDIHVFLLVEELYCELNYHDQKIWRTLTHNIRKHWTAVSILLDHISSV